MKLKRVESEMLSAAGYDPELKILEVIFNSGDRYRYKAVPPPVYEELMSAESIGRYMHENVIGYYDYERV